MDAAISPSAFDNAGSLTRDRSTMAVAGRGGSFCFAPTSTMPAGRARRAIAAIPSFAASAADSAVTPPPVKACASFFLDIKIAESTNTKDEKAAFIAAVFATMGELLGPLHHESYVHVHDVHAYGYGFGGLSQERRTIAGKLGVPAAEAAA